MNAEAELWIKNIGDEMGRKWARAAMQFAYADAAHACREAYSDADTELCALLIEERAK